MTEATRQRHVVHQVGYTFRHLFGIEELHRRVKAGDIGQPLVLRCHHQYFDGVESEAGMRWQHRVAVAGGGVLRDSGSHLLDLARPNLGPNGGAGLGQTISEDFGVYWRLTRSSVG